MKVQNMTSRNGNGNAPNQFLIRLDDGTQVFQSYASVIARRAPDGRVTLDRGKWDYSVTTGRYRNQFLREDKAATERKIKSGEYTLADLNA